MHLTRNVLVLHLKVTLHQIPLLRGQISRCTEFTRNKCNEGFDCQVRVRGALNLQGINVTKAMIARSELEVH